MSLSTPQRRTPACFLVLVLAGFLLPAGCDDSPDAAPGVEVTEVSDDGSPRGARTVALLDPPVLDLVTGVRSSP